MTDRCLICNAPAECAHWPIAVGMGRNRKKLDLPTIPLCAEHHRLGPGNAHADGWVTERLITLAPEYWRSQGTWAKWEPVFDGWLSRRMYLEAVR